MTDLTLYHGSGSLFDHFDQSKFRIPNDNWGGGVCYATDNLDLAQKYAKSMSKNTPTHERFVYTLGVKIFNLFDVDDKFTGPILKKMVDSVGVENFARSAKLLSVGEDKYQILALLKDGNLSLKGSQIFYGISGGMINTSKGRNLLKRFGFDTLRYNSGIVSNGKEHSVYLPYYTKNLEILNVAIDN